MRRFTGKSAQVARILLIVATVAGVALLAVGAGFTVARRAQAAAYDVCASGCTFTTIQDAINNTNGTPSNPATPLPIVKVAPGVYNETLTVNRAVTLQGAGINQSIIDLTTSTANCTAISLTTPATPGNITIDGFTIEGAQATACTILMLVKDTRASDVVTVENNLFYNDATIDPTWTTDGSLAIYAYHSVASTVVTNNTFKGLFQAMLLEDNRGPLTFTGNDITKMISFTYTSGATTTLYPAEGVVFLSDDNENINSLNTLSGNTFEKYAGLGIGVDAGYPGTFGVPASPNLPGSISNLLITSNHFNLQGVASGGSTAETAAIYLHAYGFVNGAITSSISDVTIQGNSFNESSSTGHGYAIAMEGAITTGILVKNNNLRGSGSSRPLAGISLLGVGSSADISITHNIIRGFLDGASADTLAAGANVVASLNCIDDNTNWGFSVGTGSVTATTNWWGSPLGPSATGPGTTLGYGNPVTTPQVSFSPFQTAASQATCRGPVATNTQSSSNPVPVNAAYTVTATLDTTTNASHLPIASAYYTYDGGSPIAMTTSGTFGVSKTMNVSASLTAPAAPGSHTICVFGIDTDNQVGAQQCFTLKVVLVSTTTLTSTLNPSVYGQSVTFTIVVAAPSGTPTGTVTLKDGANTLAGPLTLDVHGNASFTTSALTVGTHPLVASYSGDTNDNPSTSATLNQVVNKVGTSTSVTVAPNPSVSGQTVTISVAVHAADASALTGSVVLKDGATTLGTITLTNGAGTFSTSALSVGTHNITAAYSGDATHDASNGAASATVTATPAVPTGANNAYIRIAQSSEAFTTADVAIDGKVTFPNVAACTVQTYYPITAGKHVLTVYTPSGGSLVITKTLTLTAGQYYTLGVVGNSGLSITPNIVVFQDNQVVTPNQSKVRVYHLSDTLGTTQVTSGATVVASSLNFENATGYTSPAPGSVTFNFQPTSGPTFSDTLSVSANQVYSIFLMCRGQASNAAAVGVPQSLPQTGNGPQAWVAWLTPSLLTLLLLAGAVLLLGGGVGLGSYYVIARRRGPRV